MNYFFPVGYWAFSANYNDYTYHQNIPNANEILSYDGKSESVVLTISRLLYRDQSNKTTLNVRTYRRRSSNAVNDIDIDQQRRRTAGWELGLSQRTYLGSATLDGSINWRHGTGAWGQHLHQKRRLKAVAHVRACYLGTLALTNPSRC